MSEVGSGSGSGNGGGKDGGERSGMWRGRCWSGEGGVFEERCTQSK